MSFVQGDYLTFQCGILNTILNHLTNKDLKQMRTVSKEWNRTITSILDRRETFQSILYSESVGGVPIDRKKIKLEPEQFSVMFCQKKIFSWLRCKKLINDHLINVKEYKDIRFISGRCLPPIAIELCEPYLNYWMKRLMMGAGLSHSFQHCKSIDVSIFQLQNSCDSREVEKVLREYNCDQPVKSIMIFLKIARSSKMKEAKKIESVFRSTVNRVQTEPFLTAGLTVNHDVLLPAQFNSCKCEFQATIIVFRGKGLKVTSDLFYWFADDEDLDFGNEFIIFINELCEKAGPKPINGKRVMYVFECWAVRTKILDGMSTLMAKVIEMDIEVVFVRSKCSEIFTSPFNNRPHTCYDGYIRQYSSIISIYDFSDVNSTWENVMLNSKK